jgi:hypothetical protein
VVILISIALVDRQVRLIHQLRGRSGMLGSRAPWRAPVNRERKPGCDEKTFAEEWRTLTGRLYQSPWDATETTSFRHDRRSSMTQPSTFVST